MKTVRVASASARNRVSGGIRQFDGPSFSPIHTKSDVFIVQASRFCFDDCGARTAQILLELPLAAAAGLSRDYQVKAWDEGNVLAARSGLCTGISRNACAASASFARQARGQFPAVREDLRVELPTHFRSCHVVRRGGGFVHEPFRNDLLVF